MVSTSPELIKTRTGHLTAAPEPNKRVMFFSFSSDLAPDHVVCRKSYGTALGDRRGHDPQGSMCSASHPWTILVQAWAGLVELNAARNKKFVPSF